MFSIVSEEKLILSLMENKAGKPISIGLSRCVPIGSHSVVM